MIKNPAYLGILAGIGCILYTCLFYAISREWMLSNFVYWSGLVIYVVAMVIAARGADISRPPSPVRRRIRAAFIVFVLANILYYLFDFLLFKFLDPDLLQLQYELGQERIGWVAKVISEEQAQAMREALQPEEPTIGKSLFSFSFSLIGGFILSALIAYIVQKNS